MKSAAKSTHLILLTLCAGLLGLLLRMVLYTDAMEETGLLLSGHWTRSGLLGLSVLLFALLGAGCAFLAAPCNPAGRLPALTAGAGCFLCAAGFLMTALADRKYVEGGLDSVSVLLGFAAAAALVFIGIHRCIGRRPHYLSHTAVCLAFAVRMVSQYRFWSSDPQLSDYSFYMLSHVALMLTAYHVAACDAGIDGYKKPWFFGLLGIYCCLLAAYRCTSSLFMGLCAVWVLTNLPFFRPRKKRAKKPVPSEPAGENRAQP